jgi:hypothetical protein
MTQDKRFGLSAVQKSDMWRRWKAGQSLRGIGRAFGREHSFIRCLVSRHSGFVPSIRRRSFRALTLCERQDISRGMGSDRIQRWQERGLRSGCRRGVSTRGPVAIWKHLNLVPGPLCDSSALHSGFPGHSARFHACGRGFLCRQKDIVNCKLMEERASCNQQIETSSFL